MRNELGRSSAPIVLQNFFVMKKNGERAFYSMPKDQVKKKDLNKSKVPEDQLPEESKVKTTLHDEADSKELTSSDKVTEFVAKT